MIEGAQVIRDNIIKFIIDPLMMVLFAAGFMLFVYGLVEYLFASAKGADPSKNKTGKDHMLYGVIGMFVMSSIWGIIALIDSTFGLNIGDPRNPNIDVNQLPNVESMRFR